MKCVVKMGVTVAVLCLGVEVRLGVAETSREGSRVRLGIGTSVKMLSEDPAYFAIKVYNTFCKNVCLFISD